MQPFIKWAGGKTNELSIIKENMPKNINRYIEPFIGGGAAYLDINHKTSLINDLSTELINLYTCIKEQNKAFFDELEMVYSSFRKIDILIDNNNNIILNLYNGKIKIDDFITTFKETFFEIGKINTDVYFHQLKRNLNSKIKRSLKLEEKQSIPDKDRIDNIECAIKSAYYMTIRELYNHPEEYSIPEQTAFFYFIREYCYSSMFRYNSKGEFNVPYGGISYNRKNFQAKIDYLKSSELISCLNETDIYNEDFEDFLNKINPQKDDFIFLDPPYDSEFSTYCMNEFDKKAQMRLRNCMIETKANFMLIIKDTPFIRELYQDNFYINDFDKNYLVSFKNRNNKAVNHLIITNYKINR